MVRFSMPLDEPEDVKCCALGFKHSRTQMRRRKPKAFAKRR